MNAAPVQRDQKEGPLAPRILALLTERNLKKEQLAEYLKLTRSGLWRVMRTPTRLTKYLPDIAKFFQVPEDDFLPRQPGDSLLALLSQQQTTEGHQMPTFDRSLYDYLYGPPGKSGGVAITATSVLQPVLSTDDHFAGLWLLLGPDAKPPRDGDLAYVITTDDEHYVRRWTLDGRDRSRIVLIATHSRKHPVTLTKEEIHSARCVAAIANVHGVTQ